MISAENLVYSKAALSRALKINPKSIVRFEVWDKVIFVIVKGQRPTFVSKNLFKKEFVEFRQRNSKLVSIIPHAVSDKLFLAQSEGKAERHQVEIYQTYDNLIKSRCVCEDYKNQLENRFYLKKELGTSDRSCKHQIALETFLGGNLRDYVNELRAIDQEYEVARARADLFGDYAAY
ncbi:hypothetical protein [Planktothrix agardhii]|uniref:hypothetical protein n=1 Tax=Planktothrix agardhii TaxID=1160 RepID=UPI0004891AA7|nr:hypothetical protein [Planktothrix agardhii]